MVSYADTASAVAETVLPVVLNPTPMGIAMALFGLFAMFNKDTGADDVN